MARTLSRGFNLTEVMLAVGLLAVAVLAVVGVFTSSLELMHHSENHSVASELGRELIETTRASGGYSFMPAGPRVFDGRKNDPPEAGFPPEPYPETLVDGREYQFVVSVEEHPDLPDVRAVRIEIHWGTRGRTVLETAFTT